MTGRDLKVLSADGNLFDKKGGGLVVGVAGSSDPSTRRPKLISILPVRRGGFFPTAPSIRKIQKKKFHTRGKATPTKTLEKNGPPAWGETHKHVIQVPQNQRGENVGGNMGKGRTGKRPAEDEVSQKKRRVGGSAEGTGLSSRKGLPYR